MGFSPISEGATPWSGVGWGGVPLTVLYRKAPPQGPTPYPLYPIFDSKGTPFVYLLLTNGTSFQYLV